MAQSGNISQQIRVAFAQGKLKGLNNTEIAKKYGVHQTTVCKVLRKARKGKLVRMLAKSPATKMPARAEKSRSTAPLLISVQLPAETSVVELALRNSAGRMLGTLVATGDGVCYRRPNKRRCGQLPVTYARLEQLLHLR